MANRTQIFPGILTDDTEFFLENDKIKVMSSGKVTEFTDLPFAKIQILKEEISKDNAVKATLLDMYPNSEYKRLEQFVRCRFGGLDYTADISANGVQSGEYWDCPLRGKCKAEGVLCKSVEYNGKKLEPQDIELTKKLTTAATNEVIASELDLPMGSFHRAKKNLYQKLGVQTKQQTTIIAQRLNLI